MYVSQEDLLIEEVDEKFSTDKARLEFLKKEAAKNIIDNYLYIASVYLEAAKIIKDRIFKNV